MAVKSISEKMIIPIYELGKPEINPVFFEKRVYRGSYGKVYPVAFIDKVYEHTTGKMYAAGIFLPDINGNGYFDIFRCPGYDAGAVCLMENRIKDGEGQGE